MSIKDKYKPVLDLMNTLGVKNISAWEERGTLIITGDVETEHDRKLILNKAREVNLEKALDIRLELQMQ